MSRDTGWIKSSFSNAGGDACVELRIVASEVSVRDSKNPVAGSFWVRSDAWALFLAQINRNGITR
ncbi:MAG TPA: DUF397 domain-containing protein [Micromonosporaceae bacterium]|nr:DUF397 domain-containing protein [Micromonosporaceae bacterium]